jgi:hypothetical protein
MSITMSKAIQFEGYSNYAMREVKMKMLLMKEKL